MVVVVFTGLVSMLYLHYHREKYRDLFAATLSINACFLNCSLFQKKKKKRILKNKEICTKHYVSKKLCISEAKKQIKRSNALDYTLRKRLAFDFKKSQKYMGRHTNQILSI